MSIISGSGQDTSAHKDEEVTASETAKIWVFSVEMGPCQRGYGSSQTSSFRTWKGPVNLLGQLSDEWVLGPQQSFEDHTRF